MGERNENLRKLLDSTSDGIAVHRDGRIVYANPRLAALLGYDRPDELIGRSPLDFIRASERTRAPYEQGVAQGETEERLVKKDGSDLPTEVIAIPILFDGEPSTLVHVRDVSEKKRLEAQLLAADRLASVGRVASAVVHEINNPLTYVMASLELASRAAQSIAQRFDDVSVRELREMIAQAAEGIDRVRRIVRDVRVMSREAASEIGPIGLREVIESCARMAAIDLHDRARLVLDLDDAPPVLGSEPRLAQIFSNAIAHAAQAIPPGSQDENEVRIVARRAPADTVVVEVRGSGASKQKHGAALAIMQAIVASLGGCAAIESEPGRGTCVRITLRAESAEHAWT